MNPSSTMKVAIAPLQPADLDRWNALALGYKTFYETSLPDSEYASAWKRLMAGDGVFGLGAKLDGRLVGITHYLYHTSVWAQKVCYLQDLFVEPDARGHGVARALIEAVAIASKNADASRLYWMTKESNLTARQLYDKVAKFHGFIRYDYPLA
ncbi:MAG: GNAT family N-acetyltransferase [Betaproteobacteria bacterium]